MSSVKEIISNSPDDLPEASELILNFAGPARVWAFYGEMGAGKTTLIKAVCAALEVKDIVSSPTFSIVNEYITRAGEPVFHFDFYRINSEREALDIGCEEYFYSGNYCFIEWPSRIPDLIPDEHVEVHITEENAQRTIQVIKK